jgi:hypothetical protein
MPTLYKQPLTRATTDQATDDLGTLLSEQGVLGSDALVDALSSEAADVTLAGAYPHGDFATLLGAELKELADSTLEALPLYGTGDVADLNSGYYEIESATIGPPHAAGNGIHEWELSLTKKGTRKSHLRALETSPSQPDPGHSFGNDTDGLVAIPAAARGVRALDSKSSPTVRETVTPVDTLTTEFGDVDRYDATTTSVDAPVITYRIEHALEAPVDVRVYDTLGRDTKYIEGSNGRVRQWQGVYARDHEFSGSVVCSNGRLRLRIDEPTNADATATLEAESYDAGADSWTTVSLPEYPDDLDTDWQPADVDLTRIGQARVAAQVAFEAVAGTNAGDTYAADVQLDRGREALFVTETSDGELPADLEALLEPIAATSVVDPGVEQALVAREEVRR